MTIPLKPGRNKQRMTKARFQICFTEHDDTIFRKAADAAHLTVAAWIRTRLHIAAKKEGIKVDPREETTGEG